MGPFLSGSLLWIRSQLNHAGVPFNLLQSCLIGFLSGSLGGLMSMCYYQLLELLTHLVWTRLFFRLKDIGLFSFSFPEYHFIWMGSLLFILLHVALLLLFRKKAFGNLELIVEQIHSSSVVPSEYFAPMLLSSLVCLSSGSGVSQESPIVVLGAVLASLVGQKLALPPRALRIYVIAGIAGAMSAYFGSPLTGIFALEMLHRIGFEFFEALPAVIISSFVGASIMQAIFAAPFGSFFFFEDPLRDVSVIHVLQGLFLGVMGAAVGSLFILMTQLYNRVHKRLNLGNWKIGLPLVAWAIFAAAGMMLPQILFWGHPELQSIIDLNVNTTAADSHWKGANSGLFELPVPLTPGIVFAIGLVKLVLLPLLFALNLKGGLVFALFSIGGIFGQGISMLTGFDQGLCVTAVMAATQSVVTRTPLSSALVCLFSSSDLAPQLLIPISGASFFANLLTLRLVMVPSQKPRGDISFLDPDPHAIEMEPPSLISSGAPRPPREDRELLLEEAEPHTHEDDARH